MMLIFVCPPLSHYTHCHHPASLSLPTAAASLKFQIANRTGFIQQDSCGGFQAGFVKHLLTAPHESLSVGQSERAHDTSEKIPMKQVGRHAWILLLIVGLGLAYYAHYNLIVIPGLDPDDPDQGWAWLTSDLGVIEYIKFWFRILGLWVLALSITVVVISATGYRKGQRWAWYSLLYLPAHILAHVFFWPWLAPLLLVVLVIAVLGLALPFRTFFPASQQAD